MAKKKKKRSKGATRRSPSLDKLSPQVLLEKGNLLLEKEKFQEALLHFKQLLKKVDSEEARVGLEQAYLGRIYGLAAKSMVKEALTMLDAMVAKCTAANVDHVRLGLLVQAGEYRKAARLYLECREFLTQPQQQRMEELFGALLVAGGTGLGIQDFPADSPVLLHYNPAMQAVEFYCTQQLDKLQDALKKIPLRSTYRDLRILLTGLLHFSHDQEKGRALLEKLGPDSPYAQTFAGYLFQVETPKAILAKLSKMPQEQRLLFREQLNIPVDTFQALLKLAENNGSAAALFQFVRQHKKLFSKQQRFVLWRNILPFDGVERATPFERTGGEVGIEESWRILALAAEKEGLPDLALEVWEYYLDAIDTGDVSRHKEIAMVIRLQVRLMKRLGFDMVQDELLEVMLDSLKYDPDHAETWLEAAEFARKHVSQQKRYAILREATEKLPGDIQILLAAMKAGAHRGAYKKAAGLARRVLEIDPINTTALDFLVESRLQHGRKLASQKKWSLAEKELSGADSRVRSARLRGRNFICLGMLHLLQGSDDGLGHITTGQMENGSPLLAHLLTSLESRLYGLPNIRQKEFDRALRQVAGDGDAPDRAVFLRIISWLATFEGEQQAALVSACQTLKKYFSTCADLEWNLEEGLKICEALEQADLLVALKKCATGLAKKYPDSLECSVWNLLSSLLRKKTIDMTELDKIQEMSDELIDIRRHSFVDQIEDIMERRNVQITDVFVDEDSFWDGGIDFGPFGPPKKYSEQNESKPRPGKTPRGRQLSLFDDEP